MSIAWVHVHIQQVGTIITMCPQSHSSIVPKHPGLGGWARGGTQLSFWYRCAARRAANGGLKERIGIKNRGLKN